eukprot:Hpha_TRINITY_DN16351_c0_g1::TRINITY_DN16351_c0_g1_i1::g.62715::m.62715
MPPGGKQVMMPQNHQSGVRPGQRMLRQTNEQKKQAAQERKLGYRRAEEVRLPVVPIFCVTYGVVLLAFTLILFLTGLMGLSNGVTTSAFGYSAVAAIGPPALLLYAYQNNKDAWDEIIKQKYKEYGGAVEGAPAAGAAAPQMGGGRRSRGGGGGGRR